MRVNIIIKNALIFFLIVVMSFSLNGFDLISKSKQEFYTIGSGSTGGIYFPLANAISRLVNSKIKEYNLMVESTGGSLENIQLLFLREFQLGLVQSDIFYYVYKGEGNFKGKSFSDLRGILSLYPEMVHIIVRKDDNINTLYDLKGKRVVVGKKSGGTYYNVSKILKVHEMGMGDIIEINDPYTDVVDRFVHREIDAVIITAGIPTPFINELGDKMPIKLLSIMDEKLEQIKQQFGYFSPGIIPSGTYPGQTEDIKTAAVTALIVCHKDFSHVFVEKMLTVIFENLSYLKIAHPRGADISLEKALEGMGGEEFIHPAALKFFRSQKNK